MDLIDIEKSIAYTLIDNSDPILKEKTEPFNFDDPQISPELLASRLGETMINNHGIGLAAPQVGIPLSVFVVGDPDNRESVISMFTPNIVDTFSEDVYYEEGCLSFPGLYIKIKRPGAIRVRFTDMNGETTTTKYSGMTARTIQHEYDHLQGTLYQTRANRIHRDRAMKQYKLYMRRRKKAK